MKALVANTYGHPNLLVMADVPAPTPGPDDVLIQVKACSVNFPDVLMLQDKYQVKPGLPFTPGGEASGEVTLVGVNVKDFKQGDRVVALSGWGGLAEQLCAKSSRVFMLPDQIDFIIGASTFYTYGTSYHALKDRAAIKAGETLLVLGAGGGVGLAAVELGATMGAEVIAASSSVEKLEVCQAKGASHVIHYNTEDIRDRVKDITGGKGVDVVYDPVGGDLSIKALRSMAWKGRYLVVGFASGVIQEFPANIPLLKGCSIVGVFWGGFSEREPIRNKENMELLKGMASRGQIRQHIHRVYSFEEAARALQDLLERKVVGKAVVKIQG